MHISPLLNKKNTTVVQIWYSVDRVNLASYNIRVTLLSDRKRSYGPLNNAPRKKEDLPF